MERQPPRLVALESNESAPTEPEAATVAAPPRHRAALILGMLLIVALGGLLAQSWRASQLETRVGELESQLGSAQAEIQAHEAHLGRVRDAVGDVRRGVMALETLAAQEP